MLLNKYINYLKCEFGITWSSVSLIHKNKIVLIDSGPKDAVKNVILPWFKKNKLNKDNIHMIINTHSHGDHIGGNYDLKKLKSDILIAAHRLAVDKIKNPNKVGKKIRGRFSNYVKTPPPDEIKGVDVDIPFKDRDVVEIEGLKLNILHTPGHDTDCICIYEPKTKTLFTGDSIQGGGTKTSGIAFYQDVVSYRKSLEKVKTLEIESLILGHPFYPSDGIIKGKDRVKKFIDLSLNYTYIYDKEILKILSNGTKDILNIAKELIKKVGMYPNPPLIFLALYTINTHLNEIKKTFIKTYKS